MIHCSEERFLSIQSTQEGIPMKLFKRFFITILLLLLLSPVIILGLAYMPNVEPPSGFDNSSSIIKLSGESLLDNLLDMGNGQILISEALINQLLAEKLAETELKTEQLTLNYLYVDLKEARIQVVGHITTLLGYKTSLTLTMEPIIEDNHLVLSMDKLKMGRVPIPKRLIQNIFGPLIMRTQMDLPENIDLESLKLSLDLTEINPYEKVITIKSIEVTEDDLLIKVGLSASMVDSVSNTITPIIETAEEAFNAVSNLIPDADASSFDNIMSTLSDVTQSSQPHIDENQILSLIETAANLSEETKALLMVQVQESIKKEDLDQLKSLLDSYDIPYNF